jgi:hypothetical protein
MAVAKDLLLVKDGRSYWLINGKIRPFHWIRKRVIRDIVKGSWIAKYAHRGAMRVKK